MYYSAGVSVVEVKAMDEDTIHEYGIAQRQSATDANHGEVAGA